MPWRRGAFSYREGGLGKFFLLAARAEFRERFVSWSAILLESTSVLAGLYVYWFTSKAFAPAFGDGSSVHNNYFSFVLLGEIVLLVPISCLDGISRALRKLHNEGSLEVFFTYAPHPIFAPFLSFMARLPTELARLVLMILLATLLFEFHLSVREIVVLLSLQLLTFPIFLAMGFFGAAAFLCLGRGDQILVYLGMMLMAVAGAYFPVSVLPPALAGVANLISPYNLLMNMSREYLEGGVPANFSLAILAAEGLLLLPLSVLVFSASIHYVKKRGSVFVLPR